MPDRDSLSPLNRCLHRVQNGDDSAREELFSLIRDRLLTIVRTMMNQRNNLRNWLDSDDVVQNVCIRLDRTLQNGEIGNGQHFLALAAVSVRHELLDLVRTYSGSKGPLGHAVTNSQSPSQDLLVQTQAQTDDPKQLQVWTDFHELVGQLPNEEREAFQLRWYLGLTLEEIADTLKVSLRTANRRFLTAKLRLAEQLDPDLLKD